MIPKVKNIPIRLAIILKIPFRVVSAAMIRIRAISRIMFISSSLYLSDYGRVDLLDPNGVRTVEASDQSGILLKKSSRLFYRSLFLLVLQSIAAQIGCG